MRPAFIIMQIGQPDLDKMCGEVIVPALNASGLDPRRVDKHSEGGLLKSEIVGFIKESEIIVADLTNERPNCYLEIGYAMGLGKFPNLILTCREDHSPNSPNHDPSGPRIHFDLAGYDILFWHPDDLGKFRSDLEKKTRRRLRLVSRDADVQDDLWSDPWFAEQWETGTHRLSTEGFPGGMGIGFTVVGGMQSISQPQLLNAADFAQVASFGWPIGIVPTGKNAPKVKSGGIVTEIRLENARFAMLSKNSYDFWSLRENGDFLLVKSIYEDEIGLEKRGIFFDKRIARTAEALLYCHRLYSHLGLSEESEIGVFLEFFGLEGRVLSASEFKLDLSVAKFSSEEALRVEIREQLGTIKSDLAELVKELVRPLFILFEYQEFGDSIYEELVEEFLKSIRRTGLSVRL